MKRVYPYHTPIYKNKTQPMSYPWEKPLTDKDPVIPLPQPGPSPIAPTTYEPTIYDKFLEKNRKPILYKNQTRKDISHLWDKPPVDKDPAVYPQPTPVPLKRVYDITEYKYPDTPYVPTKEEPIALGAPPPKVERSVVEYKYPDSPFVPIKEATTKEAPIVLGAPPSKPTPVQVKIPPVAVNEVVLPTTKYTQTDTMKRRSEEPFDTQATHQTAPPGMNFSPIASQTSGEFSTPPPLVYFYPIIRKKKNN